MRGRLAFAPMHLRGAAWAAILLFATAARAETRQVEVPLVIPPPFLERMLVEQVFTEPDTSARIASSTEACNEILLTQPTLKPLGGRIFVTAHGRAHAGFSLFGSCYRPFDWEGEVEAEEGVRVAAGAPAVEFRVVNSWLQEQGE